MLDVMPKLSISACTTWHSGFEETFRLYRAAGIDGIGIWEFKLPAGRDVESAALLRQSGLGRRSASPKYPASSRAIRCFLNRANATSVWRACARESSGSPDSTPCASSATPATGTNATQMRAWVIEAIREPRSSLEGRCEAGNRSPPPKQEWQPRVHGDAGTRNDRRHRLRQCRRSGGHVALLGRPAVPSPTSRATPNASSACSSRTAVGMRKA